MQVTWPYSTVCSEGQLVQRIWGQQGSELSYKAVERLPDYYSRGSTGTSGCQWTLRA